MAVDWTEIGDARICCGDALAVLPELASASVDAVVTDPPAGIKFMGVGWDSFAGRKGGKGHDPSVVFDKVGGNSHSRSQFDQAKINRSEGRKFREWLSPVMAECLRVAKPGAVALVWAIPRTSHWTATAIEDAGWVIEDRIAHLFGTGFPKHKSKLKPACEDWWLCRKPGPKWLGVEGCRIGTEVRTEAYTSLAPCKGNRLGSAGTQEARRSTQGEPKEYVGRWPANVTLDDEAAALLDEQTGELGLSTGTEVGQFTGWQKTTGEKVKDVGFGDHGGASRFFYVAKASKRDRDDGNTHPTVKNTALMRWLCKLACPKGGTILDPFAGSGSTLVAAWMDSFMSIGIERDPGYFAIAKRRLEECHGKGGLFDPTTLGADR